MISYSYAKGHMYLKLLIFFIIQAVVELILWEEINNRFIIICIWFVLVCIQDVNAFLLKAES